MDRFLDKAAIIEETRGEQKKENPWRLVTVTSVEETKLILNVIPIWLASIAFGVTIAQATTLFVKQAAATNLNITPTFKIPPASVATAIALTTIVFVPLYDKTLVPFLRNLTGNDRGITILQRIGIGFATSVTSMAVAALVERKRLGMMSRMSVFWLVPQYVILGLGDVFGLVGLQEYFYDQVPDSMRSVGMALYLSVIGVGSFFCSFLITIVNYVAMRRNDGRGWNGKDINSSRLDKFYWVVGSPECSEFSWRKGILTRLYRRTESGKPMGWRCCRDECDCGVPK